MYNITLFEVSVVLLEQPSNLFFGLESNLLKLKKKEKKTAESML